MRAALRRACLKTRDGPVELWQTLVAQRSGPTPQRPGRRHYDLNRQVKALDFLHLWWRELVSAKPHFPAPFFGLIFNFALSPTQLVSCEPGYGTVRPYSDDDLAAMIHQVMALRPTRAVVIGGSRGAFARSNVSEFAPDDRGGASLDPGHQLRIGPFR